MGNANSVDCDYESSTRNLCESTYSNNDSTSGLERDACLWVGGDVPCIDIENKNDCSVFKEKDLCEERSQCIWEDASCRQKSKCADFSNEDSCPDTCTWRNKCIAPCETRETESSCADDECIWDTTTDSPSCRKKSECADFSNQESCPGTKCVWGNNGCSPNGDMVDMDRDVDKDAWAGDD